MWKNILWAAVAIMLFTSSPASAFKVGETNITTKVFCTTLAATRVLSAAISAGGYQGYIRVIKNTRIPCYDFVQSPYLHIRNLTVVKKLWTAKVPGPSGIILRFYKLMNPEGTIYYSFSPERVRGK